MSAALRSEPSAPDDAGNVSPTSDSLSPPVSSVISDPTDPTDPSESSADVQPPASKMRASNDTVQRRVPINGVARHVDDSNQRTDKPFAVVEGPHRAIDGTEQHIDLLTNGG